ncbi:MAG: signal peptidase [Actinomycetota bacterium]|jgi:signal peptidase I
MSDVNGEPEGDQPGVPEEAPPGPQGSVSKVVRDWLIVIGVALVAALLVRTYVLQQFYISGPSMETTMYTNDRVLVNKLSYRFGDIDRGDVVVFDRITMNGNTVAHDDLIKRVVALAGESVEIRNCDVYINDARIDEPYLPERDVSNSDPSARCRVTTMRRVLVPAGHVFVMGDNRPESFDSRSFGSIPESLVIGRAFAVVWPLGSIRGL